MPNLLDKKQDVIAFELTKHGKKRLSEGKLQPQFVSFFDDGIIYENGADEDQNSIQSRLFDTITFGSLTRSSKALMFPMGKSSMATEYAPAWDINILNGTATYQADTLQYSHEKHKFITLQSSYALKQFDLSDINVEAQLVDTDKLVLDGKDISTFDFDNDKTLTIHEDYILIDLKEINCEDDAENFELEVYVEDINAGEHMLNQLIFDQKQSNIIDGILYSQSEMPTVYKNTKQVSSEVQYFLEIEADDEIDIELIKSLQKTQKPVMQGTYSTNFDGPVKDDC